MLSYWLTAVTLAAPLGGSPTFTDATGARLIADPPVGSADTSEKDFGVGDFDQDGDLDVVVARRIGLNGNNGQPLPNTLFMNEGGVLTDRTASLGPDLLLSERSRDVVVADFNADGWLDLVIANGPSETLPLLLNQGEDAGVWQGFALDASAIPAFIVVDAWSLSAGDLRNDGDAYPDLFVGVRSGNDRILGNLGEVDGAWAGFTNESSRLGANASTTAVRSSEIVDINGDGDLDIVEGVTAGTGAVRILPNDGTGQFTGTAQSVITGAAYNFSTGDLDGNGNIDIIGVRNGSDQYRLNTGSSGDTVTFGTAVNLPNTNGFGSIAHVSDLNTDGLPDVLICDLDQEFPVDCSRRLKIYFNTGEAPYLDEGYPIAQPWTPSGTSDVALIDLDDDGDLDMFIGHCNGNSVFMQDGAPAIPGDIDGNGAVDFQDLLALLAAWGPCDACPEDIDGNGDVDFNDLLTLLANWS